MLVGFTTTYAISAFHHWCCEFEPRSGRDVQHYGIKFVSDLRQIGGFSLGSPVSSTNKTDCHDIAKILLKVALNTIKQAYCTIINELVIRISFYDFEGYWVYHYHFQQFSSYIMTTRLVRYQKAWTVIMNWPVKPPACGRCLEALALEMGIRAQTSVRGVILVVGVLKPWHVRSVLGLKLVSEVLFLW